MSAYNLDDYPVLKQWIGASVIQPLTYDTSRLAKKKLSGVKKVVQAVREATDAQLRPHFESRGIEYPPKYVRTIIYKREGVLIVSAGNTPETAVDVLAFPMCAMDFAPGPKLREGDERPPKAITSSNYTRTVKNCSYRSICPTFTR